MSEALRPQLGDFASIVCMKAIVVGTEQALGEKTAAIALIAAGRVRGRDLANRSGLTGVADAGSLTAPLNAALGADGTRLCLVEKVEQQGDNVLVHLAETVCSAGEPPGSPRQLTFTLGAIQGALETALGRNLRGKQVASVLRGGSHDVIEFTPR